MPDAAEKHPLDDTVLRLVGELELPYEDEGLKMPVAAEKHPLDYTVL